MHRVDRLPLWRAGPSGRNARCSFFRDPCWSRCGDALRRRLLLVQGGFERCRNSLSTGLRRGAALPVRERSQLDALLRRRLLAAAAALYLAHECAPSFILRANRCGSPTAAILRCPPDDKLTALPSGRAPATSCSAREWASPGRAVVDPVGRSFDVANLWPCDNSVFPSALAANPALTITALSLRTAEAFLAGR